jgi:hypothetical protein
MQIMSVYGISIPFASKSSDQQIWLGEKILVHISKDTPEVIANFLSRQEVRFV